VVCQLLLLPVCGELHPKIPLPAARRGITGIKQYFLVIKPDISEEICILNRSGFIYSTGSILNESSGCFAVFLSQFVKPDM
jgi:hypothetical protein